MKSWTKEVRIPRLALSVIALAAAAISMVSTTAWAVDSTPVNGQIKVCVVDPSSRSVTTTATEGLTTPPAAPGVSDVVAPAPVVAAGTCEVVATSNVSGGTTAFTVGITLGTALLASNSCINLNVATACSSAGPSVVLAVNGFHGSVVTFTLVALPPPPPPPNLPVFVIGDVEPHAKGDVVNFWGAQWWKNNIMSGVTSPGNSKASFKGYANGGDIRCGGNWTSLPGNSTPPPATIPAQVMVVVTSTVLKNGPNIGGDIVQIVIVDQDGNYEPNPGHAGNGPVASISCTL